jgi:septum formation protein
VTVDRVTVDEASRPRNREPVQTETIVLASASPRRRELLTQAGVAHVVVPADVDESEVAGETPLEMSRRLAHLKASTVARRLGKGHGGLVLGSDTIVVLGDVVFGKPADAADAVRLLQQLVGRTHIVITAVAIVDSLDLRTWQCAVESEVTLRDADDDELERYVATGEPLDKAGAYAIQGEGRSLVAGLSGSRTNVIGLPLDEALALLAQARSERALSGVGSAQ